MLTETGSFRDWDARVFSHEGRVLRALTPTGLEGWEALSSSDLFSAFTTSGGLVRTVRADESALDAVRGADPRGDWVAVLEHERLPFVSYPYEWSFSMLKDAALLQLGLLKAALAEDLTLKDATPYNIQWRGCEPVFVDVGSFERLREGEPWAGYRQFCMLFLFPLLLEAYRGIAFQLWLRGSIDGLAPSDVRPLFTLRDVFRRGVLRDVVLHARLERRYAEHGAEVRKELRSAGFDKRIVEANVDRLTRLVRGLRSRLGPGAWDSYRLTSSYAAEEIAEKDEFVRNVVGARRRRLVWDLGCNDGRFALMASDAADLTVAMDADQAVIDALYTRLRDDGSRSVLPLVVDLADPSPAIGWRNRERLTLDERGVPDLVLCLALVHHLSITRNVPLQQLVEWLRSLDCEVVVEFPGRDDVMVQRLLAAKRPESHPDYDRERFESLLRASFDVVDSRTLASGTRTLYVARPR